MVFVRYTSKQWTGELKRDFYQAMRALAQCTAHLPPLHFSLFSFLFCFFFSVSVLLEGPGLLLFAHFIWRESREIMRYCSLLLMDSFACLLSCSQEFYKYLIYVILHFSWLPVYDSCWISQPDSWFDLVAFSNVTIFSDVTIKIKCKWSKILLGFIE